MPGTSTRRTPQTTRAKMKAAVHRTYGSPDVIELADVDKPIPEKDEVLVRVRAAGVNWADWSITTGIPYVMRLGYGLRRPRSGIRGTDVAGVVEAIGPEARGVSVGDAVVGWCTGAFAEYVTTPADHLVPKSETMTFEQAAAIPMAGTVALQALRDVGRVTAGDRVLINGASGGIGTFAVQIAKATGADVTGVCSARNLELVRELGADHVIDYSVADYTRGDARYHFILDIPDDHTLTERRRVLTTRGTLVPNSGRGGPWFGSIGRIAKAWLASPFVSQKLRPFLSVSKREDLVALLGMIEGGTVTPVVDRTFPLEQTSEAVAYVGAGHTRGKVVVTL